MNLGNNLHCFLLSGYLSKYTTLLLVVLLLFVMRCTTIIFYNFTVLPVNSALCYSNKFFSTPVNHFLRPVFVFADGPQIPEEPEVLKEEQQEEW